MQSIVSPLKTLALQKAYDLTAQQLYNLATLLNGYGVERLPSGNFQMQSLSRPGKFHTVNPFYESCTCEHASKGYMCFHLATWAYIKKMTMGEWMGYCAEWNKIRLQESQLKELRSQDDAIHYAAQPMRKVINQNNPSKQDNVIAQREEMKRLERINRTKQEWKEELS